MHFFSFLLLFQTNSQTPEKKHSESSRGRKRKADTYSESSQGMFNICIKPVYLGEMLIPDS